MDVCVGRPAAGYPFLSDGSLGPVCRALSGRAGVLPQSQVPARTELAWTCFDYADSLRERRGEGDRAKAITLLDESLTISSDLGMRPLMERVLSRRETLKA